MEGIPVPNARGVKDMKKTYENPTVELLEMKASEDILNNSDVDIDVGGLFN